MTQSQDADQPVLPDDSVATDEAAPRKRRSPRKRLDANRDAELEGSRDAATDSAAPSGAAGAAGAAGEGRPAASTQPELAGPGTAGPMPDADADADADRPPLDGPGDAAQDDDAPRRSRRNRRRGRKGRATREDGSSFDAPASGAAGLQPEAPGAATRPPLPMPDAGELFATVTSGAYDLEPLPADADGAQDDRGEALAATGDASGSGVHGNVGDEGQPGAEPAADAASGAAAPGPDRRVLLPDAEAPKLQKVLAQAGVGSRRDLEQMIIDKRVTVNGEPAHTGQRVSWGDRVAVDGKPVRVRIAPLPARVVAYHKPVGEVVSHDDPQQRPTVFRRLPRLAHGKWQSVGRLDINTEGLLLFTTSGELANQLMHPRFGVEREYAVRVLGTVDSQAKARLLEGVSIDGQPASFKSLEDGGGEGANHWYRVVITEGRNREVRRLFDAVGLTVSRLIRIRYGSVLLPRGLRRGVCVDLSEEDVRLLKRLTGLGGQGGAQGEPGRGGRNKRRGRDDGGPRLDAGAGPARSERGPRPDLPAREAREPRPPRPPRENRDTRKGPADRDPRSQQPSHANRSHGRQRPHAAFGDAAVHAHEFEDHEHDHDHGEAVDVANIPNPLQQTFDQRAIREARSARRELSDDAPIPNPLQQTYDKRALKDHREPRRDLVDDDGPIPNPLQQTYDKRFAQGGRAGGLAGPGRQGGAGPRRKPGGGGGKAAGGQPDPMKTAIGYIGGDAFLRKKASGRGGKGGGGPGGGGNRRGGRGGGGPGAKGR